VVRVGASDVLREVREDVEYADRIGEPAADPPVVVAQETVVLLKAFGRIHFTRRKEWIPRGGTELQPAVRPLPARVGANVEAAGHGVPELEVAVAPVVRDAQDPLHERVRVASLHEGSRQESGQATRRSEADLEFPEISTDDRLSPMVVVVAGQDGPHERRDGPRIVEEAVANGERKVLERGVPAVAGIDRQVGDERRGRVWGPPFWQRRRPPQGRPGADP